MAFPPYPASVAAGGASKTQIYEWLKADLTRAHELETRGASPLLNEDLEMLLVGFTISMPPPFSPLRSPP